jgi:hypothetical protein
MTDKIPTNFRRFVRVLSALVLILSLYPSSRTAAAGEILGRITQLVSYAYNGTASVGHSNAASISPDGRYVVFTSWATNIIPGGADLNSIYLRDLKQNSNELISVSANGGQAMGNNPSISANGNYVVFESSGYNFGPVDNNNSVDIYLRDRANHSNELISVNTNGIQANANSSNASISSDGRYVVFQSLASNLVEQDTNSAQDIFIRDRVLRTTQRVSNTYDNLQANGHSENPVITPDGRYVIYDSQASNLVIGGNSLSNVYLFDRIDSKVELISVSSTKTPGNHHSTLPSISDDGSMVAFQSYANNLDANDTNSNNSDIFLRNRGTKITQLISRSTSGGSGNDGSWAANISGDGRWVTYLSKATDLVAVDNNGRWDAFLYDAQSKVNELASLSTSGVQANANSNHPRLSVGGEWLVFDTTANLATDINTNGYDNIFVRSGNEITQVQINQGLGRQQGTPIYVAGKATVIRVFLASPVQVDPNQQRVVIKRNNVTLTTLHPLPSPASASVLDFFCPQDGACGNWQAGDYTFETTINGATHVDTAAFRAQRHLRLLLIPIRVVGGKSLSNEEIQHALNFLRKTYPIDLLNGIDISWGAGLDISAYGTNIQQNRFNISLDVWWQQFDKFPCGLPLSNCYDRVVGIMPFVAPTNINCKDPFVPGWTYPALGTVIMGNGSLTCDDSGKMKTINFDTMEQTLAHEIGHHFGLGDEYEAEKGANYQCTVNPPPPTYHNSVCPTSTAVDWAKDESGAGRNGSGSTVIGVGNPQDFPYDVIAKQALGDRLSFMGSGGRLADYWISPAAYRQLLNQIGPITAQVRPAAVQRIILASGFMSNSGEVNLEPWYPFDADLGTATSGAYTIQALDASSQVLASRNFDVSFTLLSDPPETLTSAPFEVSAPFPAGTVAFRIMQGATILKLVPVSAHSPTVTLLSPNGSQVWSNGQTYTIQWIGSDADNDPLAYTLLYSPDGVNWITLETNLTGTSLNVDAATIPGGQAAQVRVIATDGVNSFSDTSDANFTVENKPPEAYILNPADHAMTLPGNSFYLQGYGYSRQEGTLPGDSLHWTLDGTVDLGSGSLILVNLPYGNHELKLTVADSHGVQSSSSIHVYSGYRISLPAVLKVP